MLIGVSVESDCVEIGGRRRDGILCMACRDESKMR